VISFDTNILFFYFVADRPLYAKARAFIDSFHESRDVFISELMLTELYVLLRNPVVLKRPLSAEEAVHQVNTWRTHPKWRVAGFPGESDRLHKDLWRIVASETFSAGRIFDARLALVLRAFGVTEFATANTKDFEGLGFRKVWNPLSE
jgi:predicted nucleic acid-binding protein